ncbi:uncharacterized protein LOC128987662 isoform X2 [Macrosteles quadrilineatus]|uniref:uncharacterized protein LOC128987662 isoform X2 n=1 Tax=Macrosteles quadrilineatus TaxID=74068 RepID=UPI0023E2AD2A|nr:uncharacterized protein LOC128987662 isoform X2 [Macrosteles quadrilineatus]
MKTTLLLCIYVSFALAPTFTRARIVVVPGSGSSPEDKLGRNEDELSRNEGTLSRIEDKLSRIGNTLVRKSTKYIHSVTPVTQEDFNPTLIDTEASPAERNQFEDICMRLKALEDFLEDQEKRKTSSRHSQCKKECEHKTMEEEGFSTDLNLETREKWNADPPFSIEPLHGPAQYVFCALQTECEPCKDNQHCSTMMREIQSEHAVFEKLPDIRYNFLIGGDGRVYEGRGWNVRPTLPERYSSLSDRSYYIGFIGDLSEEPTQLMLDARDMLMSHMLTDKKLNSRFLHFQISRLDQEHVCEPSNNTGGLQNFADKVSELKNK